MEHTYSDTFYQYIESGARQSAQAVSTLIMAALPVTSVLDVGCGRGVWLSEWEKAGVADVVGIDGSYVDQANLAIDPQHFCPRDLMEPFDLGRRFDLVQSLEVAEHLPHATARGFVESLVRHGDIVLFSAAVRGQGGEHHVNEQPLQYWRELFAPFGFAAFDAVRPRLAGQRTVEPWYRYNTIIYANADGRQRLPADILAHKVKDRQILDDGGDLRWKLRRKTLQALPQVAVTWLAMQNAKARAGQAERLRAATA
jgi:SAM-dependent methyltransferase